MGGQNYCLGFFHVQRFDLLGRGFQPPLAEKRTAARWQWIWLGIETLTYQSFFSKVNADGTAILPVEIVRGVANQKARLAHACVANG